jgi:hypothetical protein
VPRTGSSAAADATRHVDAAIERETLAFEDVARGDFLTEAHETAHISGVTGAQRKGESSRTTDGTAASGKGGAATGESRLHIPLPGPELYSERGSGIARDRLLHLVLRMERLPCGASERLWLLSALW